MQVYIIRGLIEKLSAYPDIPDIIEETIDVYLSKQNAQRNIKKIISKTIERFVKEGTLIKKNGCISFKKEEVKRDDCTEIKPIVFKNTYEKIIITDEYLYLRSTEEQLYSSFYIEEKNTLDDKLDNNLNIEERKEKINMQVLRKTQIETEKFELGDQIVIKLKDFGDFTATVHKTSDKGTLLIFDSIVTRRQMNSEWTNNGGFKNSELNKWMQSELLNAFPEELKSRIISISIPTYGQMFGHDDCYQNFEPDNDEQLPLMKNEKDRVATFDGEICCYWLKNATKKKVSSAGFAFVNDFGIADDTSASDSLGVLPAILLR